MAAVVALMAARMVAERAACALPDRQGSGGGFPWTDRPPIAIGLREPDPPPLACRGSRSHRPHGRPIATRRPSITRAEHAARTRMNGAPDRGGLIRTDVLQAGPWSTALRAASTLRRRAEPRPRGRFDKALDEVHGCALYSSRARFAYRTSMRTAMNERSREILNFIRSF